MNSFSKNINNTVTNEMIHEYVWDSKEMETVSMRTIVHKLKKAKKWNDFKLTRSYYKLLSYLEEN